MEYHHYLIGDTSSNDGFPIAMLVYRSGFLTFATLRPPPLQDPPVLLAMVSLILLERTSWNPKNLIKPGYPEPFIVSDSIDMKLEFQKKQPKPLDFAILTQDLLTNQIPKPTSKPRRWSPWQISSQLLPEIVSVSQLIIPKWSLRLFCFWISIYKFTSHFLPIATHKLGKSSGKKDSNIRGVEYLGCLDQLGHI